MAIGSPDVPTDFDQPAYAEINRAREAWLRDVLVALPIRAELRTALDVGCGAGHFTKVLDELGFDVAGCDLRAENLDVCRRRLPHLTFSSMNLDESFTHEGRYDLVLMFGILYHLQSPLQSILRLAPLVGRVAIVSTRAAFGDEMALYLFEEHAGSAHNEARVTAVPTLPAYTAMLAAAGLEYVYRPDVQVDHPQWAPHDAFHGQRQSLIVAREPLDVSGWTRLVPPSFLPKWGPTDGSRGDLRA